MNDIRQILLTVKTQEEFERINNYVKESLIKLWRNENSAQLSNWKELVEEVKIIQLERNRIQNNDECSGTL